MITNKEIAGQFKLLAKLMDLHGENPFKSRSYTNAAFQISKLPVPLQNMSEGDIRDLPGIGVAISSKIGEILTTGKLNLLQKMLETTPPGIVELLDIKGLGAKKLRIIWKEMDIEDAGELLYACAENRLLLYKGFGKKTQENIAKAVEFFMRNKGSFLYAQAEGMAMEILELLKREFESEKVILCGDMARQVETISEIEYVLPFSTEVMLTTLSSSSFLLLEEHRDDFVKFSVEGGPLIILYQASPDNWGTRVFLKTGSEEFLKSFQKNFPKVLEEEVPEEPEVFRRAGIAFIPPYMREGDQPLQWAKEGAIPTVLEPENIRGIIHAHSDWSDGIHTLEKMANACRKSGYEYLVISDHSRAAVYAKGLTVERIRAQHQLIDELNEQLSPFRIFKSIECDILNDGSLDYSDSVLSTFDLVIASIHSNLKMTKEKAMQRLLKAIENPYTTILGHMTGRLLLSRPGYPVDYKKVIDACAKNKVVIELNANPRRLDIRWQWIPYALSKNVLLSVNPDAHSIDNFSLTRYGVWVAQKAGVTAADNLSSYSLAQMESFLAQRRG